MKKIFTIALMLNFYLGLMIENYCLGNPSLSYSYSFKNEIFHYIRPVKTDGLESLKEKLNNQFSEWHSIYEKEELDNPLNPYGLLIESGVKKEIYLISKSQRSSTASTAKHEEGPGYEPGDKVTVTAEPNPGFKFFNWTFNGQEVSREITYEFVMPTYNVRIQANFKRESDDSFSESGTSLLEGLISFYEMNTSNSGVLMDSHGQNHGKSTKISNGKGFNENGNSYDGKSSISSVPHSNSLNLTTEFTLMADIFREGNGQRNGSIIIGKTFKSYWPENQSYSLGITDDNRIKIRTNIPYLKDWVSSQKIPLGKWVRVIATYKSGEGYSLYLDIVEPEKSGKFSGSIQKSDLGLTIGSASLLKNAASGRRIEGILDNVGIWNRQLSQAEIEELITTKITYPDFGVTKHEVSNVRIVSPVENSKFDEFSDIEIEIDTESKNGKIEKVELFSGETLISILDGDTFKYTWKDVPAGEYNIKAKAFHVNGGSTESAPVIIDVNENKNVASKPGVAATLLEGLVSFYEMNTNNLGVLMDSHGENHGQSSQINHDKGFTEKGNMYDGKSSISSVPHSASLNLTTEFTLMADIFREGNGQRSASIIIGKTYSTSWPENQAYSLAITKDNKIRVRSNISGVKDWVSSQTVPTGKWLRIIATYKSGEGYSLYFDTTKPEKSGKISGTIAKSNLELTIGSATMHKNAASQRRFEGILDNVGMWNRKLSQKEITELITKKISYPDFGGNQFYRISMSTITSEEEPISTISTNRILDTTKAEAGEKLIFMVEDEEKDGFVFDHWSMDGAEISNKTLFELDMPEKDINLIKHFRTFIAPEISIAIPDHKSEVEAFSDVRIEFITKSNDAEIEEIELLNGDEIVGQLSSDSSEMDWKNIPEGSHELVARISDTSGKTYFSDPVLLKAVQYSKEVPNVLLDYVIGPNPTSDYLNVFFTNLDGVYDFEIKVISMNGSIHKTFEVRPEGSNVTIDVSELEGGLYVLQLQTNGFEVTSKKFIKK